jgi:hypothetical protein
MIAFLPLDVIKDVSQVIGFNLAIPMIGPELAENAVLTTGLFFAELHKSFRTGKGFFITYHSSRFFRVRRGGLASVLGAGSSACALGRSYREQPSGPPSLWQRWPASMDGQRGISGF